MGKLRLEIEMLAVESFVTLAGDRNGLGTVRGREHTIEKNTCVVSCDPCATCDTSCAGGPICDCLPSGCPSCQTSCAGGPQCDCPVSVGGTCDTSCAGGPYCDCIPNPTPACVDG